MAPRAARPARGTSRVSGRIVYAAIIADYPAAIIADYRDYH